MNEKIIFFILVTIATLIEVVADVFLKKWSISNKNALLVIGLIIYFVGTIFWAISLKHEVISKAISIFTIMNLILVVLAGVLMFNESLSSINKVGIALGVISIILIEI